jgi:hypothetical protein
LAALATLSRDELKLDILGNSEIKYNMDHGGATYTRDLVEAFVGAKYKKVLDILGEHKVRFTTLIKIPFSKSNAYNAVIVAACF